MGSQVYQPVATLPKPRYAARPAGPGVWSGSSIHPLPAPPKDPVVSASSSLLGLQARAPELRHDPVVAEPGILAQIFHRLQHLRMLLRMILQWWLAADFRRVQAPILVFALGVWAMTARTAWQSEESGTPLLRESMAQIRLARARAAAARSSAMLAPSTTTVAARNSTPRPAGAGAAVPALAAPEASGAAAAIQEPVSSSSNRSGNGFVASIRSWFSPEPAARERVQGNPRRRVWVDMKTGLYYCPGADYYGYGGAQRGKVMSQRDAEYEYFQPATGAPCE